MSFPISSDISQNDTEMLEEQQFFLWLQEVTEACHIEHIAQKAKREVEAKVKEETTLLKGVEGSQVIGSKCKKVATRDEEGQWSSKKARGKQPGKYHGDVSVKIRSTNPCERCVCTGQDYLIHLSRWVIHNYTSYLLIF